MGAILEALLRTLGRDAATFTFTSESAPWLTRTYKSLTAAAKEVGGEGSRPAHPVAVTDSELHCCHSSSLQTTKLMAFVEAIACGAHQMYNSYYCSHSPGMVPVLNPSRTCHCCRLATNI